MIKTIAIIGLGSIGKRYLKLIKKLNPNIQILIVRSGLTKNESNLKEHITLYSIQDAIKYKIEAAIISSPSILHISQAKLLIDNGVHVLVEKPLSNSVHNVKSLVLPTNNKIKFLLGYCLRYDPLAEKFKEIIKSKKYGDILEVNIKAKSFLPDWRAGQDYRRTVSAKKELGGGVLLELSHEIDYALWFFDNIRSVSAKLRKSNKLKINVEDQAKIILKTVKGYCINITLDFSSSNNERFCSIRFEKKRITWDLILKQIFWLDLKNNKKIEYFHNFERDYVYKQQIKHFLNCVENDHIPKINFNDGLNVLNVIEAAKKSNKQGETISVI